MTHSWTFGQKVGAGFAVAAMTLILIAGLGYKSTERLIENARWLDHSRQVRKGTADLGSFLKDAETGQRGYLITGRENFLEPYNNALANIENSFNSVRKLTADDAEQQRRLEAMRPLIDAKMAELKNIIETRRAKSFEAAAQTVSSGTGKELMDQIRRILADMDRQEMDLLEKRNARAEESARNTEALILWGSLAGVVFIIVVGVLISSSVSKQIGSAVGHIQSSSSELQSAANQQATGSKEQAASMNEISTTISELLATSRQIAESAQRVARMAGETAEAAGSGDQTVQKTQESIAIIRRQVDAIVNHMLDLGKKSQQIGGVLEIINELAEQTNILAINASVEAAGAGESGRRFAVVADEIRKLADRVGSSTKEIWTLIEEVRAAVNTTVMATEGGAKATEAGAKQFTEVASAFQKIVGLVDTSTQAAREIELSTKQQSTAVEQVNAAIASVAQAAKETEASSSQTFQTAVQLTTLSKDLARMIQAASSRN